ncbi:ABC transporter ATP-binding protein [Eisenbergiella sp.]
MKKKNSAMARLMAYAGAYRYLTCLSYILSAVSALVALTPFWYIWRILQEVLTAAPNYENAQNLSRYGWTAVGLAVLAMFIYIASLWCSHLSAFRVQRNMRTRVMEHIITLPVGFLSDWGTGKVRKIVNDCAANTETYLAHIWPDKAGMVFTPIGLIALLLVFDWRLGLLCLIPVAIGFAVMSTMMGKKMQESMSQYQSSLGTMTSEAVEYVRGIPVVKTFGQTVFSFKRFKKTIDDYSLWTITYTKQMMRPMLIFTTAINAVFAVIIAAGVVLASGGITSELLLNLLFYIIITPIITTTMNKVMYAGENSMLVEDSLNRVNSILALRPLPEPPKPSEPKDNSITLKGISFTYAGGSKKAADGVSLSVAPGEHIALVGPSGGGKTTLASLIARFWDVQEGQILVGGVDVKEIGKKTLMDTVSFVFQDSKLFKMSVLDNIRMARPDATREQVLQALHEAQCDDILEKLPSGVDTIIGAKGVYVSGGEQQRLNIARVMLKNSPILILDEATAFADPDNESRVQAAFSKLSQGRTVIMIAHRLTTVTSADRIYVVKDGRVAEYGKHEELLTQGGLYEWMWKEYQTAASWKVGARA